MTGTADMSRAAAPRLLPWHESEIRAWDAIHWSALKKIAARGGSRRDDPLFGLGHRLERIPSCAAESLGGTPLSVGIGAVKGGVPAAC